MFSSPKNEEKYLCVDLGEEAIDFLAPVEYPPTRFIINIPASLIKASSMQVTEITRSVKELTTSVQTLRNSTQVNQEMEAMPPSDSVNHDGKSVFFDSLQIRPKLGETFEHPMQPKFVIGGTKDDETLQITVVDQKAIIKSDSSLPSYESP